MSEPIVFQVFEGMVEILFAYWSRDKKAALPDDEEGVIVYELVGKENPLFFHVRIKDLFIKSGEDWRIQLNTTLHVDLLSIHHSMYEQLQDKEDFDKLGDYINLFKSFIINLTEGKDVIIKEDKKKVGDGKKIEGYELAGCVVDFNDDSLPAYLTKVPGRSESPDLNAFDFDICFEFKADDKLRKELFENSKRKYVFAWVWTAHTRSKIEYQQAFSIDITSSKERFDFLKYPGKNFFGAVDILLAPVKKAKQYTRSQIYMKKFSDRYPYDEQSMNYIELSRSLPFKSLTVGAQPGPVGISTMDEQYFDKYLLGLRNYTSTFIVDGKPALRCKLDSDKNFKPDFAADRGVVLHGLESKLNEFFSRADNRFFFKDKSVSHWLNSLEKKYADSNVENGMDTVVVKGSFPFTGGKIELLLHDFVKRYRNDINLNRHSGSERFIEQKTFDMNTFETIHIAPPGEIKSKDGSFYAKICKGFPGSHKFLDTMHTRVYFGNSPDTWQAHAICHRPLIVTYELERDLDSEEIDLITDNPLKLLFWIGKPEKTSCVELPLTIDYYVGSKKGLHAILVYLITDAIKIEVSFYEDGIAPIDNYKLRDGTPARLFDCSCELPETFNYYTPEDTGLFAGNPIIIVDDYQEDEIKEKALSKIREDHKKAVRASPVKLLLGFIPGYAGKGALIGWDLLGEWYTQDKITLKTKVDSADKALELLLKDVLKKKDPYSLLNYNNLETPLKVMKFAEQINTATSTYLKSSTLVNSPLFDGAGFGEKPQADSLYLLAVRNSTINIDKKTLVATKTDSAGGFEFFCNREIIRQGKPPFNYQFGETGGLLVRKNMESSDSLSTYRVDYQQKMIAFKESFNRETAITLPDYLKRLATSTPGAAFSDMLKKAGANKELISYFDSNGIAQKFKKGLTNASNLTADELIALTTFLNLMMYIDSSFAYCPACENVVSLSWGWCPYHATRGQLDLEDRDGDGKFKEEFEVLLKSNSFKNPTILGELSKDYKDDFGNTNNNRLLTHWTEFLIS